MVFQSSDFRGWFSSWLQANVNSPFQLLKISDGLGWWRLFLNSDPWWSNKNGQNCFQVFGGSWEASNPCVQPTCPTPRLKSKAHTQRWCTCSSVQRFGVAKKGKLFQVPVGSSNKCECMLNKKGKKVLQTYIGFFFKH